ncbi:MAG: hypothetical protein UR54_C0004G0006 [Candidatus Roizmanbacteria bacterium GW2011_GWA2_34_18]|uniref:Uncharacterized protein n=1 Tax=Candidatus Roizmanbacteria bacterium GW2011_GWA2_34_18 TaxID=1618477 RepID=A0A0G0E1I5_9BACT|nr:MAG: hypothetical protein UR54_C0004G0006 [Candidatus Roizmanbacteria bacterium GW2011_GWA2_34_18]
MNLSNVSKSIFVKKTGNYISLIFFLLVFSIFIIFAIKPSLTTAFSLKKEELDLISEHPEVNKIIEDIKKIADKNLLIINKASIVDVNLSSTNQELQDVKLIMEVNVSFDNLKQFMTDLFSQRRLKIIDDVTISRDKESSNSGNLNVVLTIDGFYL